MANESIVVILGPTAVGKSALGISLAKRYRGEIISGDSLQVYRQLDIGTAKVTPSVQEGIPHHLIDIRDIDQGFSAYDFVQEASQLITAITSRKRLPIIVGGTGLYLQSLLEGYHLGGSDNHVAMQDYRKELADKGLEELAQMAAEAGITVDTKNPRRLMRALEIARYGNTLQNKQTAYKTLIIGLTEERQVLYDRINQRVEAMMGQGLLDEARFLYENYPDSQASLGIGYREFSPYFAGKIALDEAIAKVKQDTRRFAKRQMTWFRNRMTVDFYAVSDPMSMDRIYEKVEAFLGENTY